jgi:metal-sulfur cluster biosynthetic enzyme
VNATPLSEPAVLDALRQVYDPEIGCNIVDLGLIYSVAINSAVVKVTMTLTTPGCPMHESLCAGVRTVLLELPGVTDAEVELVWEPSWHPDLMTDVGRAAAGMRNL